LMPMTLYAAPLAFANGTTRSTDVETQPPPVATLPAGQVADAPATWQPPPFRWHLGAGEPATVTGLVSPPAPAGAAGPAGPAAAGGAGGAGGACGAGVPCGAGGPWSARGAAGSRRAGRPPGDLTRLEVDAQQRAVDHLAAADAVRRQRAGRVRRSPEREEQG